MNSAPVPANVYTAARRVYLLASPDPLTDELLVRLWAERRWQRKAQYRALEVLAFWVLSIASQDGYVA